jgi:hypothetical protein
LAFTLPPPPFLAHGARVFNSITYIVFQFLNWKNKLLNFGSTLLVTVKWWKEWVDFVKSKFHLNENIEWHCTQFVLTTFQFNQIPRFNSIWVELELKNILNLNTLNAIHIQLSLDSIELDLVELNSNQIKLNWIFL